ncbi:PP2C family protein-serine/threonine phosphatase [Streptomyces sp. NPDC001922]|uniref:PP2C family protein-serine/threonine phosphatase n=1 Tax=Streptomyces sp. NPDC001922 TaxID=3364624 RepID=UPI003682F5BD
MSEQENADGEDEDLRLHRGNLASDLQLASMQLSEFARAQGRLRGLLDAVLAVSRDLELAVVLRRVVTTAMELAGATYGALGVLDEDGAGLAEFIPVGLDEKELDALAGVDLPQGHGLLRLLIEDPRPLRVARIAEHPQAAGFPPGHPPMRSLLGVAIRVRDQVYGNIYLSDRRDGRPFDADDEAVVVALAGAAGIAIENARLYSRLRYGAEQFQRLLLPRLPDLTPFTSWAMYRPAADPSLLGGDWYDALVLPDGARAMAVGDVMGHDVRAAAAMAQVRNMLRALAFDRGALPSEVLTRLDQAWEAMGESSMATVCLTRIEPRTGGGWNLCWSNAGHIPPLLVTREGDARYLEAEADAPLGVDTGLPRHDHRHLLPAGSTVLMFTDGLVERPGQDLGVGLKAVAEAAAAHADDSLGKLCRAVSTAQPDDGPDDVALLALRAPAE